MNKIIFIILFFISITFGLDSAVVPFSFDSLSVIIQKDHDENNDSLERWHWKMNDSLENRFRRFTHWSSNDTNITSQRLDADTITSGNDTTVFDTVPNFTGFVRSSNETNAVNIKTLKVSGTTHASVGGDVSYQLPVGIDKVIAVIGMVCSDFDSIWVIPGTPSDAVDESWFGFWLDEPDLLKVRVNTNEGDSINSRPYKALVIYEE